MKVYKDHQKFLLRQEEPITIAILLKALKEDVLITGEITKAYKETSVQKTISKFCKNTPAQLLHILGNPDLDYDYITISCIE